MIKEHCALFSIVNHNDAAELCSLGLFSLQHRGEDASGIVGFQNKQIKYIKNIGFVSDVFTPQKISTLQNIQTVIGHNRYSTTGENKTDNIQPLTNTTKDGIPFSIAHNGNLTNIMELKTKLDNYNIKLNNTVDTELISQLIAYSDEDNFKNKLLTTLSQLKGSFSLQILTNDFIYALRDPLGIRPLSVGKKNNSYCFSSETCAFDLLQYEHIRDIQPGELISIDLKNNELHSEFFSSNKNKPRQCIFELIYFARPDSNLFNHNVYNFRKKLGIALAKKQPVEADIVIPIPDSGVYSAIGFSNESKIPYEHANIRNHYIGRSFIQPNKKKRELVARLKHSPIKNIIKGKKIIVVDDSIVRGVTAQQHIKILKQAGAKEIHLRISSPAIYNPCFYGIDFPSKEELIMNNMNLEQLKNFLKVDSIVFLDVKDLQNIAKDYSFCDACFSGDYPIKIDKPVYKEILE